MQEKSKIIQKIKNPRQIQGKVKKSEIQDKFQK